MVELMHRLVIDLIIIIVLVFSVRTCWSDGPKRGQGPGVKKIETMLSVSSSLLLTTTTTTTTTTLCCS